jgi:hypothetical protein
VGDQLLGEAALADTGLPGQKDEAPSAGQGLIEAGAKLGQLALAAYKGAARGLRCELARRGLLYQVEFPVLREDRPLELA